MVEYRFWNPRNRQILPILKKCFIWGMCTTILYRKLAGGYKNICKVYWKSQHPYHQEKWKEMQQKPYFSSMIRYYMHFGALYEEQESICAVLNFHMHREPMKVVTWRLIHKPLSLSFNKATRIDEMDSWLMDDKLSATWLWKKKTCTSLRWDRAERGCISQVFVELLQCR